MQPCGFSLQARCCMKGLKSMKHVDLCPAPCCPGYHEEVAFPPNLAPVVWCQKDEVHAERLRVPLPLLFDVPLFLLHLFLLQCKNYMYTYFSCSARITCTKWLSSPENSLRPNFHLSEDAFATEKALFFRCPDENAFISCLF